MKMASRFRKPADVLQRENEEGRILVEYATVGDVNNIKRLLDNGASVNAEEYNRSLFYASKNYMTPLQCAANNGHCQCVYLLIEEGADLDGRDRFDVTAVHMAAENGHLSCLRLLLDAGADCNVSTKYSKHGSYTAVPHLGGTTALHLATKNNHIQCVKELILNGADYNAVDELGRTSLYIAAEMGYEDCVLTHLNNAVGKDILSLPVKETGETPLHESVRFGLLPCVTRLLEHGSDVNHRNNSGFSPLHLSLHNTERFSFDIVKELIVKGYNTNVNLPDGRGITPLQYVCFNDTTMQERRPAVAAFLIAYGAHFKRTKNKHGYTLLQQELRSFNNDRTILQAVVKTMIKLPSLDSLGILCPGAVRRLTNRNVKCEWYRNLTKHPRSLQHYCRCAIRKALGVSRLRGVHSLPLPTTLTRYLLLEYEDYI